MTFERECCGATGHLWYHDITSCCWDVMDLGILSIDPMYPGCVHYRVSAVLPFTWILIRSTRGDLGTGVLTWILIRSTRGDLGTGILTYVSVCEDST